MNLDERVTTDLGGFAMRASRTVAGMLFPPPVRISSCIDAGGNPYRKTSSFRPLAVS